GCSSNCDCPCDSVCVHGVTGGTCQSGTNDCSACTGFLGGGCVPCVGMFCLTCGGSPGFCTGCDLCKCECTGCSAATTTTDVGGSGCPPGQYLSWMACDGTGSC